MGHLDHKISARLSCAKVPTHMPNINTTPEQIYFDKVYDMKRLLNLNSDQH